MNLSARIPKLHLHCHLEGALRATTFVELADRYGVPLRYRPDAAEQAAFADEAPTPVDPADPYRFADFREFLLIFAAVSRALQRPDDYARLAREFVADALAQQVIYGELFVSPSVWTFFHPQLDVRGCVEAIVAELRAARPRAHFALIADLTRNFGPERAMATARTVATLRDLDVIGVGLGGDEARFPPALFAEAFAFARAQGLHAVAHAGEAAGPESVRDAIEVLHAERIGHGIRALHDPAVVALAAERGVPFEVCPTSNDLTGAALPEFPHPYVALADAGCTVTIDADDPTLFRTSIAQEYARVEAAAGSAALAGYVRNAVAASFAAPELKRALAAQVDAACAELDPVR